MIPQLHHALYRLRCHRRRFDVACMRTFKMLFGRGQIRSTLTALVLSLIAPLSHATDLSDFGPLNDMVCLISSEISGPWLYAIGVVLIIVGAIAIASSESTISKLISTVVIGLGIASVAIPIMKNHFKVSYVCS